ncbi:MAG: hypothetical protein ACREWG_02135 [Gammaproteobacteria bacterium]
MPWTAVLTTVDCPADYATVSFGHYVDGPEIGPRESAELAYELIASTCDREDVARGQRTLHAERGTSMRSKRVALRLDWCHQEP